MFMLILLNAICVYLCVYNIIAYILSLFSTFLVQLVHTLLTDVERAQSIHFYWLLSK